MYCSEVKEEVKKCVHNTFNLKSEREYLTVNNVGELVEKSVL